MVYAQEFLGQDEGYFVGLKKGGTGEWNWQQGPMDEDGAINPYSDRAQEWAGGVAGTGGDCGQVIVKEGAPMLQSAPCD